AGEDRVQQEVRDVPGYDDVVVPRQRRAGFGEGAQRKCVPRGDHLVVASRRWTSSARRVEAGADGVHTPSQLFCGHADRLRDALQGKRHGQYGGAALEIPTLDHAVDPSRQRTVVIAEDVAQLRRRPYEEGTLAAGGVGVLRGGEAPGRQQHLAREIVKGSRAHITQLVASRQLKRVQVHRRELRVVIQHLL